MPQMPRQSPQGDIMSHSDTCKTCGTEAIIRGGPFCPKCQIRLADDGWPLAEISLNVLRVAHGGMCLLSGIAKDLRIFPDGIDLVKKKLGEAIALTEADMKEPEDAI